MCQKCLFWEPKDQTCAGRGKSTSGQEAAHSDPSARRNSSCHLCVPSITLKDCPVILSGKQGFSSPFIKPGEQRWLGEGLGTSKHAVTQSVRLRLPPGGPGAVYRWGRDKRSGGAGEVAGSSFSSPHSHHAPRGSGCLTTLTAQPAWGLSKPARDRGMPGRAPDHHLHSPERGGGATRGRGAGRNQELGFSACTLLTRAVGSEA